MYCILQRQSLQYRKEWESTVGHTPPEAEVSDKCVDQFTGRNQVRIISLQGEAFRNQILSCADKAIIGHFFLSEVPDKRK
jgi:hypothetical protein